MLKKDKEPEFVIPEPTLWDKIGNAVYRLSPWRLWRRHWQLIIALFTLWFIFLRAGAPFPVSMFQMNQTVVSPDYAQTHYTNGEYTFDTVYEKDVPDYLSQKNMPREQLMSIDCERQMCSIVFKN